MGGVLHLDPIPDSTQLMVLICSARPLKVKARRYISLLPADWLMVNYLAGGLMSRGNVDICGNNPSLSCVIMCL